MHQRSTRDALLVIAHYALLVCFWQARGLLLGGMLKATYLAAFALLLFFVIDRSAVFLETVTICFYALPSVFFSSCSAGQWVHHSPAALVLADEPLRPSLFQRPPPLYSL